MSNLFAKKVREMSRECHNHKPQPFPDPKRKRKPTNLNKHKSNKRTKSTKISSLFPKRGNRNTKRTEKHKNKMTHGKTYNKSPRRINHKATRSKTNTGTTALEQVSNQILTCYADDKVKQKLCQKLREGNSKTNDPIWPVFKFIRDFIRVYLISKFKESPIKAEQVMLMIKSNRGFLPAIKVM